METSPTSIISALGAGSGFDMVQLAADLSAARFAPQIAQLEARSEALEARISSASTLRNQLSQLASALGDRMRNGDLAPTAQVANSSVASASVLPGTSPSGSFSLEVSQLAQAQSLTSNAYGSAAGLVGEGTLTLRFGAINGSSFTEDTAQSPIDIAVAADDTLSSLAGKINAADSGVTAYVATGTAGAQLVLKGQQGTQNGFVIEAVSTAANPSPAPGDLTYLAWAPASDSGQLRKTAQDSEFSLDGIAMTRASNQVSGLPAGLSLQLTGTNSGTPTSITFAKNTGEISAVMGDLVAALNSVAGELSQSGNPLGGALGNDPGARALKRALSNLPSEIVMPNAGAGEPDSLSDLGLTLNRDGSFSLDSERLNATLSAQPDAATAMFTTGLFGVFATVDGLARSMSKSSDPGTLAGSVERYTGQIEKIGERISKIGEQQAKLSEVMTRNFAAADRNVSASQSTLNFLRAQIDIWNAQGS